MVNYEAGSLTVNNFGVNQDIGADNGKESLDPFLDIDFNSKDFTSEFLMDPSGTISRFLSDDSASPKADSFVSDTGISVSSRDVAAELQHKLHSIIFSSDVIKHL